MLHNGLSGVFSLVSTRNISNKCSIFTKCRRALYLRQYPTVIVQPDGSTYTIRYHEPRKIIKLPLNLNELSEEERNKILHKRKPKEKIVIVKETEDNFDSNQYLRMLKRNK